VSLFLTLYFDKYFIFICKRHVLHSFESEWLTSTEASVNDNVWPATSCVKTFIFNRSFSKDYILTIALSIYVKFGKTVENWCEILLIKFYWYRFNFRDAINECIAVQDSSGQGVYALQCSTRPALLVVMLALYSVHSPTLSYPATSFLGVLALLGLLWHPKTFSGGAVGVSLSLKLSWLPQNSAFNASMQSIQACSHTFRGNT